MAELPKGSEAYRPNQGVDSRFDEWHVVRGAELPKRYRSKEENTVRQIRTSRHYEGLTPEVLFDKLD